MLLYPRAMEEIMSLDRGSKKTRKEFNRELSKFRAITAATIVIAGEDGNRREIAGEEIYVASDFGIELDCDKPLSFNKRGGFCPNDYFK